ncbi:MAG: ATP-binding protein [Dissulfurispiraceae bacterium]
MAESNRREIPDDRSDLRQRAEERLKRHGELDKMSPASLKSIVHELQVHQIELEMQNDELRSTQHELETAREKYFTLYDLAPVGYVTLSGKGIIRESNLMAAALLGVERANIIGQPLTRFIYMEDQDLYYTCQKQLVREQADQWCVMRMMKKGRAPFWVRIDIAAATELDNALGTRVVIIDISERKRVEAALTESEKRYHLLFKSMSEGAAYCKMLYDGDGKPIDFIYLEVNPAFERLTGLRNVVGKNVTEIIPGIKESHPELFEIYSRVALTGHPERLEIKFKPLAVWFSITVYSTGKGYFVAAFDNITKRKQAELRRALSAEILSVLNDPPAMDDTMDCIVAKIRRTMDFDAIGIRLQQGDDFPYIAQDGFSKEFLFAENTLAVRNMDGGICRDKNGNINLECTCGLVISGRTDPANPIFTQNGSFWTNESYILLDLPVEHDPRLHPRNRCIHSGFHSVALIPLRAGKDIVGILQLNDHRPNRFTPELISFFEDLGAMIGIAFSRKQAEQEMIKAKRLSDSLNVELAAANEDLEAFSYSVSHDLRAPLRHMTGFARLLQKRMEGQQDEKTRQFALLISDASAKMERLIDDLLSYARLGRDEMPKREVNLSQVLKESIEEILEEAKGRDIEWKLGELPIVYGEPSMLKLVLVNFISNAIKFTSTRHRAEIEIDCAKNENEVVCFVKDNGAGFDMNHADRLFGVFQRLHTQAEFEGTGIGLANVRRIIALHGGRTWAEGSVDKGATFYFALPLPKQGSA